MSAVCVTRAADGYTVARTFRTQSAAQRALNVLLEINETAFEPSKLDVLLAEAEQDDPPPHDGRLFTTVSADEE